MSSGTTPFRVAENLQRYPHNIRMYHTAHTASKTLTYRQTGSVHTNLGASGAITLTLPQNADKGVRFTFMAEAAQDFSIDPGAAGAIYIGGSKLADDKAIKLTTIGDNVTLECDGNHDWVVVSPVPITTVSYVMNANADLADQAFFVANRPYQVLAIREVHSTAGSDGGAVNLQVTKDDSTDAPGAGTNLLTDNTNAGFDLKGTANTVQTGTLATTADLMSLAAGDRLSVDFAGTLTAVAGVVVTVDLVPITWA